MILPSSKDIPRLTVSRERELAPQFPAVFFFSKLHIRLRGDTVTGRRSYMTSSHRPCPRMAVLTLSLPKPCVYGWASRVLGLSPQTPCTRVTSRHVACASFSNCIRLYVSLFVCGVHGCRCAGRSVFPMYLLPLRACRVKPASDTLLYKDILQL